MSALRAAAIAVIAAGAAVLTSACAAGQQAQTADERPSLDGTYGTVGKMQLRGVALRTPPAQLYDAGADVPLIVYIANNGNRPDVLTNVTSPAFTSGWDIVPTNTISTKAAPTPSVTSLKTPPPPAPSTGQPQTIGPNQALGVGFTGLNPGGGSSPTTIVLHGLSSKNAPLSPGMSVPITFTFADAGQTTLTVPVQLNPSNNNQSVPVTPPAG